jgi:valyl-tRNA synthetase
MIKPAYGEGISKETYDSTIIIFEDILKLLHPFMPFISEELWHVIKERPNKEDALIISRWPEASTMDEEILSDFDYFSQVVSGARNVRKENNISFKEPLEMMVKENEKASHRFDEVIKKLCNLSNLERVEEKVDRAYNFLIRSNEYFIPMSGEVDIEQETKKLEEELEYTKGFLNTVQKKLGNERFVSGAPDQVVASERKKEADAIAKIKVLEETLSSFQ